MINFSVGPYYFTAKDVKDKTSKKVVKSDDKKKIYIYWVIIFLLRAAGCHNDEVFIALRSVFVPLFACQQV